jgi:SAM-dependent methyltransferase
VSADQLVCAEGGHLFSRQDGIWRFLLPEREEYFHQFVRAYEMVRQGEKWGSDKSAYYQALPDVPRNDPHWGIWQIRRQSFQTLQQAVIQPLSREAQRPLTVVDVGAGNGWLSYRLQSMGHEVMAVDLLVNESDGLGARQHYPVSFTAVQAEFDRLPLVENQIDLVIFNGSFHYAADFNQTVQETTRVLKENGSFVIMDTPIYHDGRSGQRMVAEREAQFHQEFGVDSPMIPHENFLTFDRLAKLETELALCWRLIRPSYGWRWALRPWLAQLRRHREPATFLLIVGQVQTHEL